VFRELRSQNKYCRKINKFMGILGLIFASTLCLLGFIAFILNKKGGSLIYLVISLELIL
jgi:uncharacterized membrane protein